MYEEGDIADGPNGTMIFRGGRWQPIGAPQQQTPTAIPLPVSARQQAADARAQAESSRQDREFELKARNAVFDEEKARRDAMEWQATRNPDGSPKKPVEQTYEDRDRASRLNQVIAQINRVQELFDTTIGKTSGVTGWKDYLPTPENKQFDTAGAQLSQQGLAAFRVPGTGTVSDRDAMMFDRANLPEAKSFDSQTLEQLRGLRSRVEEEARSIGMEPPKWTSALDQTFMAGKAAPTAAGAGADEKGVPVPDDYQAANQAFIASNLGRPDFADRYTAFRVEEDRKRGFGSQPDEYRAWAEQLNKSPGGRTVPQMPPMKQKMSGVEQFRNNLVSNPFGAAVAGAADAGGFGVPTMLAGDQMNALGDQHPFAMAGGQIAGSIAGTAGIGKAAGLGLDTLAHAPRMANIASRARGASPFAKSLATDTAYAGLYGANTGQDPMTSAALGAAGSGAGQGIGAGVGRALGGLRMTPQALALRARGIPLTIGQSLGGMAKSTEDAMSSIPFAGDMVNARRLEGYRAFNQRALNDAGRPVGAKVDQIGEAGVEALLEQIGNSYDNSTAGVSVPLDARFAQDLKAVANRSRKLPPDLAPRFSAAMDNRLGPIAHAGKMTGDTYQQAMRGIKGYRAELTKPGFEQDYRDVLGEAQDALTAQMRRGGGAKVVEGLGRSDKAYRMAKVAQKAIGAAKNGSSGEIQVFTPAQLNTAAAQNASKFGGKRPMNKLIDAAQSVLPSSVPDSGTAKRLMSASVGAGGLGVLYGASNAETAAKTGGLLGLLALGGTKGGQKALQKLLIDRPDIARKLGTKIGKKKGLLGTASLPFLIGGGE